jgi:hypothetical protein
MLMHLATGTRPDLAYSLGQPSRFVSNPTVKGWSVKKGTTLFSGHRGPRDHVQEEQWIAQSDFAASWTL